MTIKQVYLFSATLLCTLACSFGCHASESEDWKTTLCKNIPELSSPEHAAVLRFFCQRHELRSNRYGYGSMATKELAIGASKEFSEHMNPADRVFLKKLPRIMYELLIAHQAHNNRLRSKEPESLEAFADYWHLLNDVFVSYRDILMAIDSQPIASFYGPDQDLKKFNQLLNTYLETCRGYANWRQTVEKNNLSIGQKLRYACLCWLPTGYRSPFLRVVSGLDRKTY